VERNKYEKGANLRGAEKKIGFKLPREDAPRRGRGEWGDSLDRKMGLRSEIIVQGGEKNFPGKLRVARGGQNFFKVPSCRGRNQQLLMGNRLMRRDHNIA